MAGFRREVASSTPVVCLVDELFPFLESADVLDKEREQEMAPEAPVLKPNKIGKAALPLKPDRVSVSILCFDVSVMMHRIVFRCCYRIAVENPEGYNCTQIMHLKHMQMRETLVLSIEA